MHNKHTLHERIKKAGITHIEAAQHVGMPFETMRRQLNGYSPMSAQVEEKIEDLIKQKKTCWPKNYLNQWLTIPGNW